MKKLSSQTIAKNCTDLRDIYCGISEIEGAINIMRDTGVNVPLYFYTRINKLKEKRRRLITEAPQLYALFSETLNLERTYLP